jgi:hypothetical protein
MEFLCWDWEGGSEEGGVRKSEVGRDGRKGFRGLGVFECFLEVD